MTRFCRICALYALIVVTLLAALSLPAHAARETYGYDALGRLVRYTDPQGKITEYVYDAVGNILSVTLTNTQSQQNPVVTSVVPNALRRGETKPLTLSGANLNNVTVSASHSGMTFSNVVTTASQVTLSLTVADTVPLGAAKLTLSNGQATADANLTIQPRLPTLSAVPAPLAVPPDNVARNFTLALSEADVIAHTVTIAVDQTNIATVSPAAVTFAAGETTKILQVTGKSGGQAVMSFTSTTLAGTAIPVFVTAEFQGINTTYAPNVGVQVGQTATPISFNATLASSSVGVTLGSYLLGISPNRVQVGATANVIISGAGFASNSTLAMQPAEGLTLGTPSISPDGTQISFSLTVAANAATTLRRLVVTSAGQPIPSASAQADRVLVVTPVPEITAISPIHGTPGSTLGNFAVYGRNLGGATAVVFSGGGITAGSSPTVNAAGTELTTGIAISPVAQVGPRAVTVQTPAGESDATLSPANTFNVVNEFTAIYDPILAPLVGVVVGEVAGGTTQTYGLTSEAVGVILGKAIKAVSPATGAQGQSLTLTLTGQGFAAPVNVTLSPDTGLTLGTATVSADGASITLPLTIASDAPLSVRAIQATSGGAALAFADAKSSQFLVTAPVPVLQSVDPITVPVGSPALAFTLRGRNFQNIQQVKITPPEGILVGTPQVNAAGDTVTVVINIAANAATGARVVSIVTPAGESASASSPANTITLVSVSTVTYSPVFSPLVGLQVGDAATGTSFPATLVSPLVGITVDVATAPVTSSYGLNSAQVGIAVGSTATGIAPQGYVRGASSTLTVSGLAFPASTTVAVNPATGVTLGSVAVSADGSSLSVPLTVAIDAALGTRALLLNSSSGPINFTRAASSTIAISPGAPTISSLSPILARQGETIALTIRGTAFNDLVAVTIEPPTGIVFDSTPIVSTDNTQIDLKLRIDSSAALGGRVVRVTTLGGQTTTTAAPANTFTIYPP